MTVDDILNKLVVPQLPFPIGIPKKVAVKCALKAKENITQAKQNLLKVLVEKLPQETSLKSILMPVHITLKGQEYEDVYCNGFKDAYSLLLADCKARIESLFTNPEGGER